MRHQLHETSNHTWMDDMFSESPGMVEEWSRRLGGGGAPLVIDFTVLVMAIMALSLLMIVEIIRHRIDYLAKERVFYGNILNMVYRELSTLGIVEAVIFLIHHYVSINLVKERVFAEVHFTIFFVAIINAIQCIVLYLNSLSVAEKEWVKMEAMDINHYVAIRRQFDIVDNKLHKYHKSVQHIDKRSLYETEGTWFSHCVEYIRHSSLKSKHKRLLVQVRFHELRVHFIELNKLHPKFSVADYLKLSLNDVFDKLVHISTTAWLSLIMFANLILFSMNLVAETTKKQPIGIVLTTIYLAYGGVFLFLSVLVKKKVRNIFFHIMREEKWITREGEEDNVLMSDRSFKSENRNNCRQLSYFWGDDPQYIVAAAQFMQFGLGIPFAVLLVFNNTIFGDENIGWKGWYILTPFLCYSCFVWLWSRIIPQFTQCTSLGELVKRKHLVQIEAKLKLRTAKRKRKEEMNHIEAENKRSELEEVHPSSTATATLNAQWNVTDSSASGSERLLKISDYVKKATKDLPDEKTPTVPNTRRRRRKAVSDGVAAMRLFAPTSAAAREALQIDSTANGSTEVFTNPTLPPKRKRLRALSAGVGLMRVDIDLPSRKSEGHLASLVENIPSRSGTVQHGKQSIKSRSEKDSDKDKIQKNGDVPSVKYSSAITAIQTAKEISVADNSVMQESNQTSKNSMYTITSFSRDCDDDDDDDDFSDVIPDIAQLMLDDQQMKQSHSFKKSLQLMYLSSHYRLASTVFGTMLTFFMLAWRMVMILLDGCTIVNNQNMWNFIHRSGAYWINVVLLGLFIIESLIMCIVFGKKDFNPHIIVAGAFDIALSGVCLGLLLWAESDRCCDFTESNAMPNACDTRYLAEESTGGYSTCEDTIECCPLFGTRLCGGIGNIEPCTSIIILRVARFMLGKEVHNIYQKCMGRKANKTKDITDEDSTKMHLTDTSMSGHSNLENNMIVLSDLWIKAITENPDIVEKHGAFSGAVLEVMLGIESLGIDTLLKKKVSQEGKDKNEDALLGTYPDIQFYIEAGKTQRPSIDRRSSVHSIHESEEASHSSNLFENDDPEDFTHPACVLIRSMRRCQCKLLPLLDEWTTVDIVLTEHEIVWFEVSGPYSPFEHVDIRVMEPIKGAIRTTKGGRGLRLCDVATGRTILGRMSVTDIDNVKVQRLPTKVTAMDLDGNNDEENTGVADLFEKEYWENEDNTIVHAPATLLALQETKWLQITEDRLKIHSTNGALFLARFFADLRREEVLRSIVKNPAPVFAKRSAIIWCQSISHLCGNSQLKQKLPHFGGELDKELIDFLEVVERH